MTPTQRVIVALAALALALGGLLYVQGLRHQLATKKAALAQASAALTAASNALRTADRQARETQAELFKRHEIEARYEQDRQALAVRLAAATDRRVHIPRSAPAPAAPQAGAATPSGGDAAPPGGLSESDVAALETVLAGLWKASARLAAEADTCAANLTLLQGWARDHLADHHRQ